MDRFGQRGVTEPTPVGRTGGSEEPGVHCDAAAEEQPVRKGVEPRERHVRSADHDRHQVIGSAEGERAQEEEQHDAAVHREELVVLLQAQEVVVGHGKLDPHEDRHGAGQQEHDEARHHVVDADLLVVGARQVSKDALVLRPRDYLDQSALGRLRMGGSFLDKRHGCVYPSSATEENLPWWLASQVLNSALGITCNQKRMNGW